MFFFSLERDERNFHCWAYRYFLLENLLNRTNDLEKFYHDELSFLRSKIGENQSNYSAWHYRSKYLEKYFRFNSTKRDEILRDEWKLVLSAVYTDCSDQAAWFYARWLLFQQIGVESISSVEHLQPLEDLDQIEPMNKWLMTLLAQLWQNRDEKREKRIEYLKLLAEQIDSDRKQFYLDQI